MHQYIALLRGINVGGHKKILMAHLKALFISLGFENVVTYIQSGNVVFSSSEVDGLAHTISEAIQKTYGWEVPVLVRTASEMKKILMNCPFSEEKMRKSYFLLFQDEVSRESMDMIKDITFPWEEFHITPACMYFFCATGYAKVKMTGNFVEKKLKVNATSRNYNTMAKLVELSGN
jgi:uncharacterized protein (DUF1697 family)